MANPFDAINAARAKSPEGFTIADVWEESLARRGDRTSLIHIADDRFPQQSLTFTQVDGLANQTGHWALLRGLKRGDVAAIFMENRPEFITTWLGLAKVGVATAWINSSVKLQPLVHSIRAASAKTLFFGIELADVVEAVHDDLTQKGIASFSLGGRAPFCPQIDGELASQPSALLPRSHRAGIPYGGTMCFIYTSGTTGLPKAALIYHSTYAKAGQNFGPMMTKKDVLYGSGMPLYHSAAGMLGISVMISAGITYIIRRKFSATNWLQDVKTYGATAAQYIGELARYVLAIPERADDADNKLRICFGNGLRPEYWEAFQLRFAIGVIVEFYGATESTGSFANAILLDNLRKGDRTGFGSVGRLMDPRVVFVRYDVERDELIRGSDGFCQKVDAGEPGEMLVRETPADQFRGYTDPAATKKKLLADVFEKGDLFLRTGDLLKFDKNGWVYFVDRIGDTFRWKGENVSTAEVATELSKFEGVQEVNVYGVQIPNNEDGRAGMCAMIMEDASEARLAAFHRHAAAHLPSYAVPIFLRILPAMQITGTFKHQKVQMRNEGIDAAKVPDPLFVLEGGRYVPLDAAAYARLTSGPGAPRARL